MNLGTATLVVGGAIGLLLTLHGTRMLVTGRASARTLRNFTGARAAALYHLLFGVALLMLVLGQLLPAGPVNLAASLLAVALVGLALVRYRPRRGPQADR
jgi:hypothetical protein